MRRPFVAGNWKMNMDLSSATALVGELRAGIKGALPMDVAVCPPYIYLFAVAKAAADSAIAVGAQNCWHEASGAFTGEVSVAMLKQTGCRYVILGHSERRHTIGPKGADGKVQGESDAMIAAKLAAVLAAGLTPIVCVGETLEERDANATEKVLSRQIAGSLAGVETSAASKLVIAYEPVWAIGTGRNATPEQAQAAHKHIRVELAGRFGAGVADQIRIQYGGSVKADNASVLMSCPDVDGALVGGASLKSKDFLGIIDGCLSAKGLSARV
jgi:triosephosphate isomerase